MPTDKREDTTATLLDLPTHFLDVPILRIGSFLYANRMPNRFAEIKL